ncbi:MAG: OmpA family protein [Polyangiaceae bacterium]|nr:OmpA family protein [Polyangiaceae bacterium]
MTRVSCRCLAAVGFATALLSAPLKQAAAQQVQTAEIDLPKFQPSPAGDRFFGVPSPYAAGDLTFHAMTMLDYSREPFTLTREGADGSEDVGAVVSDQMFVHVGIAFSMASYVMLSASMPFVVLSQGEAPTGEALAFPEPSGAGFGDLRLGMRIRLFGKYHDPFQLAAGGYVWAPTGTTDSYVSDHHVHGQPHLLFGGRADRFVWSATVGPHFRQFTQVGAVTMGHQMTWGFGAGVLLLEERTLQIHVESTGAVDVSTPDSQTTNAEIIGGWKLRIPGAEFLEIGAGAGPGISTGIGTPVVRGLFQFAYTPVIEIEKKDFDKDGIVDDVDACPNVPGPPNADPAKHGCPPGADRDKDGILDKLDACPDEPGLPSEDPTKNGCPERDSDKDGFLDPVDACPTVAGIASTDPKKHGCPDTDKDGIFDSDDACPQEAGVASDDPKKNGCPQRDKDQDGIADDSDACPDIAGVKTDDPKTNGCPPDTDGDGFRDDQDACPREKGVDDPDPAKRGCPKLVRVTEKEIVILEQVQFDTGKATIRKVSDALLDSVAQVLKEHPEIVKLEVQGHTDNKGAKALNEKLSDDRAKSVKEALVKRGVDANRLQSKGYGMDKPIADNKTEAGRQQNRRVQFIVVEKKAVPMTPAPGPAPTPTPAPNP